MADRVVRNFINGEYAEARSGQTAALIDPSTGEVFAEAPVSGEADVDAAMQAAAAAFDGWRDATPSRAQQGVAEDSPTRWRHGPTSIIEAESQNTGKPLGLTRSEEIVPMVDQIRFFAGAARVLEGTVRRGVHDRLHLDVRREPIGVVRTGHARGTTR